VLDELGKEHGKPEDLVADARKTVDRIRTFIRERRILTLPEPDTSEPELPDLPCSDSDQPGCPPPSER
jgi:hypothetical protein